MPADDSRPPASPARPARRRRRRSAGRSGRTLALVTALAVILGTGTLAVLVRGSHRSPEHPRHRAASAAASQVVPPAAESGLLPWVLSAPLSRSVALPGPGIAQLTLLGGLLSSGGSTAAVTVVNLSSGSSSNVGSLVSPVHDASGATLGGRDLIFGGGTQASSQVVQAVTAGSASAVAVGALPAPLSDSGAVSIGKTAYIIGGYDGRRLGASVLATTDGIHFTSAAALPIPVRYPAVATVGGKIYIFGGLTAAGGLTSAIQVVNPRTHTAGVLAHLPTPLMGAGVAVLQGVIYLFGGLSSPATAATPLSTIWALDPTTGAVLVAGQLQVPEAHAAVATVAGRAWVMGGEGTSGPLAAVQMITPNRSFGRAGVAGAGSPYFGGNLLIADSGSNRLLLLNPAGQIVWTYPSASAPPPPGGFYYPDDAFFADHGTAITINMETYQEVLKISFPAGKVLWTYGHPGVAGSATGYLSTPDDAYQLKSGQISVADIGSCRVLILNPDGAVAQQLGTTDRCVHAPPTGLGSPNGDTPLPNGHLLVSEINGSWVSEYTLQGQLVWSTHLQLQYPSDPQQIGPDRYLVAGYTQPGQILEFNRQGTVLYRYAVAAGPGELNHPSLVELLPSGVFMLNDDHNDRMVAIDPVTGATVWQYGRTGVASNAVGLLDLPDGFDFLAAGGATPTHPGSG